MSKNVSYTKNIESKNMSRPLKTSAASSSFTQVIKTKEFPEKNTGNEASSLCSGLGFV